MAVVTGEELIALWQWPFTHCTRPAWPARSWSLCRQVTQTTAAAAAAGAGNGGFVGATGTELHIGEIASTEDVARVFPRVRLVFFCLVDVDGNPYPGNICPPEVDANFATTGIKALRDSVNKQDWDIAEVN